MQPFLALITPLGAGVDPPQPPLGIWGPTDPRPTHPIAGWNPGTGTWPQPPGQPPGIWGPTDPRPSNPISGIPGLPGAPGQQPRPDHGLPPFPSHPIYIPPPGSQPPLGIWGPTDPRPGNPIAGIPGLPGSPDDQPHPAHPIVLPPNLPPTVPPEGSQPERKITWTTAWSETTGWVVIGVPSEGTLVPTPST